MNCKQGDLAIVVTAPHYATEFIGRIYTCLSLSENCMGQPAWEVSGNRKTRTGQDVNVVEDKFLKPLDAPLNEDETITDEELTCTD